MMRAGIIMAAVAVILFIGGGLVFDYFESDDKAALERQLQDKDVEIAGLRSENQKYVSAGW